MEFIKIWTYSICITLIASVLISLLLPAGTMGRYSKLIISLFIFLSFLLPFANADLSFALPDIEEEEFVNENENTYSQLIETEMNSKLNNAGYTGITVNCDVQVKEEEIEIKRLVLYIPDEYGKKEIFDYVYANFGMIAEVYAVGE